MLPKTACSLVAFGCLASLFAPPLLADLPELVAVDLGPLAGPDDPNHWGLTSKGWVLGFHESLTGSPRNPPIRGGGGHLWIDQDENGYVDSKYTLTDDDGAGSREIDEYLSIATANGGVGAKLMEIDEDGTVVGTYFADSAGELTIRLAVWQRDGAVTFGPEGTGGLTINRNGLVLEPLRGFLWTPGGAVEDLESSFQGSFDPEALQFLDAVDLNDRGELLIKAADRIQDAVAYYTWTPGGGLTATGVSALAIGSLNNEGQAVLLALRVGEIVPGVPGPVPTTVVWNRDGGETIPFEKALALAEINDHGLIVGTRNEPQGPATVSLPFIWDRAHGLRDLRTLVAPYPGLELTHAVKVNDFGQIVALGKKHGESHAFLLSPRLGLSRWWATAGSSEPLTVTWRVRLEGEPGKKQGVTLRVREGTEWRLRAGATLTVVSNGWREDEVITGFSGSASLGDRLPGTYVFRIDGFDVPRTPVVERVEFELEAVDDTTQGAFFVADHPELPGNLLFQVRTDDGGTRLFEGGAALAAGFAPIFHFQPGDLDQPYSIAATWGIPETPYEENPSWCAGVPARGDEAAAMDLWRYLARASTLRSPSPHCQGEQRSGPPTVYAALVLNAGLHELAINYFFHYPRSDWARFGGANTHEGDWEGITVFLRFDGIWIPQRVAFAQHVRVTAAPPRWPVDGGQLVPWRHVERDPQSLRPHVFVGLGGHASYPWPRTTCWPGASPTGFLSEVHNRSPEPLRDVGVVRLPRVGSIAPDDVTWDWLLYPGRWGRVRGGAGLDGPPGPLFSELATFVTLMDDAPVGRRWLDPWLWSSTFGPGLGTECSIWPDLSGWFTFGRVQAIDDGEGGGRVLVLTEGSDAAISREVTVPLVAPLLAFQYRFTRPGGGDALVVSADGVELWSLRGQHAVDVDPEFTSHEVDLSSFAGRVVILELRLRTTGPADSEVELRNIALVSVLEDLEEGAQFRRGDANGDGTINISDPVFTLAVLFLGVDPTSCLKSADADDSGSVNLTDAVYTLQFLFLGGPRPLPPGADCGVDPTTDELPCDAAAACR